MPSVPWGRYRVVIDPGHGGPDVGAVGHGGIRETDVVLDVSNKVSRYLSAKGVAVQLTRTADVDLDLSQKGYSIDRVVNYTSEVVEQIDLNTLDFIKKNPPNVIYVYSEKSAINLKNLIYKYSLVDVMMQSNLMCISKKTSKVLEFIKWKKIIIFNPGEEEFFLKKIN